MKNMYRLRKYAAVLAAMVSVSAVSCQKESESPSTLALAVNDIVINLDAAEGSEHVLVYSTGQWKAVLKESSDWLTVENGSGNGNGEFIISFTENKGLLRRAGIELSATGVQKVIELTVKQKSAVGSPTIEFAESKLQYIAWETVEEVGFTTNVEESALNVESTEPWIKDLNVKDGKVGFTLEENTSGVERSAKIALTYTDVEENVYRAVTTVTQTAEPGSLVLGESEMTVDAFEAQKSAAWDCHLGTFFSRLSLSVEYEGEQKDWISSLEPTAAGLNFTVAENTGTKERKAVIKAEIADKGISVALSVTQASPSKQYTFEQLRALLSSAGEYPFEGDWFEGVIVADAGQKNMETNPMTSSTSYDDNESAVTNYIQTADGKYGIRLKFTAAETSLKKGDKVKVSLAGTTLVRDDNPVRYTLKGLTINNVAVEATTTLVSKTRAISELSDDDIYTWTTVKDVEIAFSYGSYNNVRYLWLGTDGSVPNRQNLDYRILRDASSSKMNMLVNSDVKWYMTDSGVPQGSGNISGVIVSTTTSYHGSELLGRYQIRPMELSDITLGDDGFSVKLLEWYSFDNPKAKLEGKVFSANVGTGTMSSDASKANQTTSLLNMTGKEEGSKAFRYDGIWWKGGAANHSVKWSFSTSECAGKQLYMVFSSAVGKFTEDETGQAPVNWNLEYSLDGGESYTLVQKIRIRPLPAKTTSLTCLPGALDEYCIELPSEISGQASVVLRLIAADDTTINFSTGEYTEHVTYAKEQYFRFGAVAVKYNK